MTRLKQHYADRPGSARLAPDPAQAAAVDRLDQLSLTLSAPRGWFGPGGAPGRPRVPRRARDERIAAGLWDRLEQLTGVRLAPARTGSRAA